MKIQEFKNIYIKETYLGDGLYVRFDGYYFILRAPRENGDHYVALEPKVFDEVLKFRDKVEKDMKSLFLSKKIEGSK